MSLTRSVSGVLLAAALAAAQPAPEKKLKDGEYDLYNETVKDINTNNFTKSIVDLDAWAQKFPDSEFKDERSAFYVQAYAGSNQPAKALDAGTGLIARDPTVAFPGPTGQPTVVRLLYSLVWAVTNDPDPTPAAAATGEKAARQLMDYDQPIAGVAAAEWQKARVDMKDRAAAALFRLAMLPGVQAMAKQPQNCPAAEAAFTAALHTYPDKAAVSWELGRALNCQSKEQPAKLSGAIYEFERATAIDPSLGNPKADPKTNTTFADNAYIKVHGSDEGLGQLKQLVRQSPLPPEGFKIKTATEIADEKSAEFEKSNPQLALWMKIKGALVDADGERYFTDQLKDSGVPQLRGVLMEAKPACRPRELMVAVPLPDSGQAPRTEILLKLDKPLAGKPQMNQEILWEGVPTAFTKEPFLLTMEIGEAGKLESVKSTPCAASTGKK